MSDEANGTLPEARLVESVYRRRLGRKAVVPAAVGAETPFGAYLALAASELAVRGGKGLGQVEVDLQLEDEAA